MRATNKLTALGVSRAKKLGRYADGGNLYLQISDAGNKAWLFRFMLNGNAREMGLGPIDLVSLAEAREAARECRKLLLQGIDPIEARRQERQKVQTAAAELITFKECAEKYIAAHEASWRNPKHRDQWKSTLKTYVYPVCRVGPKASRYEPARREVFASSTTSARFTDFHNLYMRSPSCLAVGASAICDL